MITSWHQWFSKYYKAKTWLQWPPTLQLSYLCLISCYFTSNHMITNTMHILQTWVRPGNMTAMLLLVIAHAKRCKKYWFLFNTERSWYTLITEFNKSTLGLSKKKSFLIILLIKTNCTEGLKSPNNYCFKSTKERFGLVVVYRCRSGI